MRRAIRAFGRDQSGAAAASFMLMLPLMFGLFIMTLDTGFNTTRSALLDQAVDMTARSVRNGTIAAPTLANIKTDLCSRLTMVPRCAADLKVQIISVPRATFAMPATTLACTDQGATIAPVRRFVAGQQGNLAVLRACMRISTLTPATLIAGPTLYEIDAATIISGTAS